MVAYFALSGEKWKDGANWLIGDDLCTWNGVRYANNLAVFSLAENQ